MATPYYDLSIRTVAKATEDLPRHSEASIIELKDGSLLMAWQRHEKSDQGSNDTAPGAIALMNSFDGGKTWENERIVAGMIEGSVNCYSPSFFRCKNSMISLFFRRYMVLAPGKQSLSNVYRIDSTDEGKSFGPEQILWECKPYAPINDSISRLASGASLMTLAYGEGTWLGSDDKNSILVLRSEDDFKTWTISDPIRLPMRGAMEPYAAQQANGRITMVMRTQLGSVFKSESVDDGRIWSKPQTTGLRAPESCPCVATIPGTDVQIVVWNNSEYDMTWTSHYGKRTPLTIALSRDGLQTFTDFYDLETDPNRAFTNPSVIFTSDGFCLIPYWTCQYNAEGRMGGPIDLKLARFRIYV